MKEEGGRKKKNRKSYCEEKIINGKKG